MQKNNGLRTLTVLFLYKFALDIEYAFGSAVQFSYMGTVLRFNLEKYLVGVVLIWGLAIFTSRMKNNLTYFFCMVLEMFSVIPAISLYGLRDEENWAFLCLVAFWSLFFVLAYLSQYLKVRDAHRNNRMTLLLNSKSSTMQNVNYAVTIVTGLAVLYLTAKYGMNVTSSLLDVYGIRQSVVEEISQMDTYLMTWAGALLLPWSFAYYVYTKKKLFTLLTLVLAFMAFSIKGMKTWLFVYPIILVLVIMLKGQTYQQSIRRLIALCTGWAVFSWAVYIATSRYELLSITERVFWIPSEINYYYLYFFHDKEKLFLRESIMRTFFDSPYNRQIAAIIHNEYINAATVSNATNGLLGDAFANFGILGVIFYPFMIISAIRYLTNRLKDFERPLTGSILLIILWSLSNTSFFTWLMTCGYLVFVIIVFFMRKAKRKRTAIGVAA